LETTSQAAPFPYSGDFEAWAGIPIEPARLIQQLPLEQEERHRTLTLLEVTQAAAPSLYQALPQQIIHRDYDQSNVLMDDGSVTGVLDFEFCGPDLRVLDLAYALSQWPEGLWNTGEEWAVIDAFGRGYLQHQNLTLPELESLPLVLRLRATTSLYFRFGRYVRGLETSEDMVLQIREALYKETWLQANAEELLHRARNWLTRPADELRF
jgi:homoserine kinase type II